MTMSQGIKKQKFLEYEARIYDQCIWEMASSHSLQYNKWVSTSDGIQA